MWYSTSQNAPREALILMSVGEKLISSHPTHHETKPFKKAIIMSWFRKNFWNFRAFDLRWDLALSIKQSTEKYRFPNRRLLITYPCLYPCPSYAQRDTTRNKHTLHTNPGAGSQTSWWSCLLRSKPFPSQAFVSVHLWAQCAVLVS